MVSLGKSKFSKLMESITKFGYNLKLESKMDIVYRVSR